MATEVIEKICHAIGSENLQYKILDKIIELAYDDEITVRVQSIDLLTNILSILPPQLRYNRITHLFLDLMTSVNEDIKVVMSQRFGMILEKLQKSLIENEQNKIKVWMIYKVKNIQVFPSPCFPRY